MAGVYFKNDRCSFKNYLNHSSSLDSSIRRVSYKSNKIAPNHNKNIRAAPKNSTMDSVIGIDVGTGSVRGCAFDLDGNQISEPEGNSLMMLK